MDFLLVPLAAAAALFGYMVVTEPQTVYIENLHTTRALSDAGYSGSVIATRIGDRMREMEQKAHTRVELRRLNLESENSGLDYIAEYLHLTPMVRAAQKSVGLVDFEVGGEIVERGSAMHMRLRIERRGQGGAIIDLDEPKDQIEHLIAAAAERLLLLIDPQILCSARFREGLKDQSFEPAKSCIAAGIKQGFDSNDRVILTNLRGVVAFAEGQREAAERFFREAIRLEPDYSPALLNLGVLHRLRGEHENAIQRFREVFHRELPSDSPQTYAATYLEWALSMTALGKHDEATELFKKSAKADPKFANVYFHWAKAMLQRGKVAEAQALLERARGLGGEEEPIYTENLLGLISLDDVPQLPRR